MLRRLAQELAATKKNLREAREKIDILSQQVVIVGELQVQMAEQDELIAELEQLIESDKRKQVSFSLCSLCWLTPRPYRASPCCVPFPLLTLDYLPPPSEPSYILGRGARGAQR